MFTQKKLFVLIGRNVIIALSAVFLTGIFVFFISKQIQNVSNAVALNHRLEAALAKRIGLFETIKHDLQTVGLNDTKIEGAFISSDNILGFVNALDDLAAKNKIIQSYGFETPQPSPIAAPFRMSTIPFSNSFTSNMQTFSAYLDNLNKLPYFAKVDSFTIASQDKLGWQGPSNITFRATLYARINE